MPPASDGPIPDFKVGEYDEAEVEAARVLFARPATFVMGAAKIEQLPEPNLPEIAFAGRSNVGKSSLINGLVGMHKLARASNEPGRTREVNFFDLDGKMRLVDLPGYGWAKASKTTVKKFQDLGRDYLRGRVTLKRVYLLIDARHGLKSVDKDALDALDNAAVSYQIVLTKADKIKAHERETVREATLKAISKRPAAFPAVIVTSAEKGLGMPELRAEIMRTTGALL
ncbi:ribosome biogenesis GTP-binding protein YihA/YsxC [Brevundimonas sp.]|uniref:ribosome biogenesis GTP-binding protein YihA/YsxC n=1 Tax=Brevundimonas sp. TaxID=1871086 RepID=UPI00378441FC